ncbi:MULTISPECIES: toll/interleukin-1 receptor domain-containing protein [Pseudomonas]|uniref:Toll/interleukin-1 receptor domain-containing protein n=1 Tax=Pseudomonas cucumis TaxID=2954082 RepID=A0ABY9EXP1_9PSED|nr:MULTISPECIES: toll/interleukin-1 receptor domain-containing protein [Pseudomonas]MDR8364527.1 toll/interleukin-1 receptor domain-containing protein [Pseudomonas sp. JL3]URM28512.1 toll/interleukin-1 receptor domain-containing protein [Pseudomonas frederiksbergensis]WLG85402.1 toll/interleukin-1 receptor domain-containing protein [Pseudomonas cucumis]WLG90974.1 toll/interleukin-1 receptor domain-containing protein [Pseudomonas cucumis]
MPVFISYRHSDRPLAIAINTRLKQANIKTYLDVLDPESQTTDDITGVITRNITECTHLLAVVSERTAHSWWVPFEIGEATISNRRICSFKTGPAELPLYLDKWPKLSTDKDMEFFIDAYREEVATKRSMTLGSINESLYGTYKRNAELFHDQLKHRIRRGF